MPLPAPPRSRVGAGTAPRLLRAGRFPQVEKIDAHVHVHGTADRFMAQALQDNFRILTINVDDADYPPISEQQQAALSLQKRYPGWVAFAATFSVEGFRAPGWGAATREQIEAALAAGAVGVKIWKNIGMELRDPDGSYVMPDDARLEPIIAELERGHVVLLGHQAEPLNCWLPYAKMTVRSDREYFREHPQYYMYQHPRCRSHDSHSGGARSHAARAPGTALRRRASCLARMGRGPGGGVSRPLPECRRRPGRAPGAPASTRPPSNRDKVRAFLLRYQDRILYGSDVAYGPEESDAAAITGGALRTGSRTGDFW